MQDEESVCEGIGAGHEKHQLKVETWTELEYGCNKERLGLIETKVDFVSRSTEKLGYATTRVNN